MGKQTSDNKLKGKIYSVKKPSSKFYHINKTRRMSPKNESYNSITKDENRNKLHSAARRFFLATPVNNGSRKTPRAFRNSIFTDSVSKLSAEQTENNERQWHGKILELRVVIFICQEIARELLRKENSPITKQNFVEKTRQIFGIYNSKHTSNMDIDFKNHFGDIQIPDSILQKYGNGISVKFTKQNQSINMGDILNQYNDFEHHWTLIVGFYKQKNHMKIPLKDQIYCIHLEPENREFFFGTCEKSELAYYKLAVSKANSAEEAKQFAKDKPIVNNLVVNPKINSKQQRVQCSINQKHFDKLLHDFKIQHYILKTSENKFLYNPMKRQSVHDTIADASSSSIEVSNTGP